MDKKEKQNKDPVPKLKKKRSKNSFNFRINSIGRFKSYIIAGSTALIIGAILGFIMLNMLTNVDQITSDGKQPVAASNDENQERKHQEIDEMNAYVLQLGVFGEKENSEHWREKFKEKDVPVINWEFEDQYYLLTGVSSTEQELDQQMDEMKEDDMEAYKKNWTTSASEIYVTDEELEWLTLFQANWQASLDTLEENKTLTITPWEDLLHEYPEKGENIKPLKEAVETHMKDIEKGEEKQERKALLSLWLEYDDLLLTLK